MSWSIKATGLRPAVKSKVVEDPNIPEGIKAAVSALCDDVTPVGGLGCVSTNGISVEGYGHTGGGFGSIGRLIVEPTNIILS